MGRTPLSRDAPRPRPSVLSQERLSPPTPRSTPTSTLPLRPLPSRPSVTLRKPATSTLSPRQRSLSSSGLEVSTSLPPSPRRSCTFSVSANSIVETGLGKFGISCMEDLIHEIWTVGPHFKEANIFLWPFKLSSPHKGFEKKRHPFPTVEFRKQREPHQRADQPHVVIKLIIPIEES